MPKYDKRGGYAMNDSTTEQHDAGQVPCPRDGCDWSIREDAVELELAVDIHLANEHGIPWEES